MCVETPEEKRLEKWFWEEIAPLLREIRESDAEFYTIEDAERDLATIEPEDLPEEVNEKIMQRVRAKLRAAGLGFLKE